METNFVCSHCKDRGYTQAGGVYIRPCYCKKGKEMVFILWPKGIKLQGGEIIKIEITSQLCTLPEE